MMNKSDLVTAIAESTSLPKSTVAVVLNGVHETITANLVKGENVRIPGFGTFYSLKREARKGRNPKTGETVEIPAKMIPKFRAGKTLKDSFMVK